MPPTRRTLPIAGLTGDSDCNANCSVLVPALDVPNIKVDPRSPPVAGCIVARPRASDGTDACEDDWMIGTGLRVMMVSPVVRIGALWMGRVSTESKITLAARTGFGGSDVSVTRTVTG